MSQPCWRSRWSSRMFPRSLSPCPWHSACTADVGLLPLMRVITLNVNGIRSAAKKGLFRWLAAQRADLGVLQEMKGPETHPDARLHGPKAVQASPAFAGEKGYMGRRPTIRDGAGAIQTGSRS